MGKVYLFNPQPTDTAVAPLALTVNSASPSYQIPFARKTFDFVPSSTSGNRFPGTLPHGNDWVASNSVLVAGVPPNRLYQVTIPEPPPQTADLILYVYANRLLLFGTDGLFLRGYDPQTTGAHVAHTAPAADTAATAGASYAAVATASASAINGTVYVFNLFSETMSNFSPNGQSAGQIPGWSKGGSGQPPIFTPFVLKVGRVLNKNEAPGHIVNGSNDVSFIWPSGISGFTMTVDGNLFPITQNLFLYILRDRWFLMDQFGVQRGAGPIDLAAPENRDRHNHGNRPSKEG